MRWFETPNFTTILLVEAMPQELEKILSAVRQLKDRLMTVEDCLCSEEEHTFVCGCNKSLIKFLPVPPEMKTSSVMPPQQALVTISIESDVPAELVRLNNLLTNELRSLGVRYRRIG